MERGRILILGNSKETTYEIRSLLDNQRFELEIALSPEVGKSVLSTRHMNLIMVHTELFKTDDLEFLEFLRDRSRTVPLAVLGDEAFSLEKTMKLNSGVRYFNKPYDSKGLISFIEEL